MNGMNDGLVCRTLARAVIVGFVATCGLSNMAQGSVSITYGPGPGQWGTPVVVDDGEDGITWKITNNRPISIRFCAYRVPPGCPESRIVGGPNPNEIACSAIIPAGGGVSEFVVDTCGDYEMCAFVAGAGLLDGETEVGEDGSTAGVIPPECTGIPTVSEWGLIILTLLLLTAGTIVFARWRRPAMA